MYCCVDCDDYLNIPVGAIAADKLYEVTQFFSFICRQNERQPDDRVLSVKEYNEEKNRTFKIHVQIVTNFTSDLSSHEIRVKYSQGDGIYNFVPSLDESFEGSLPDLYFTVSENRVIIYTKHFSEFIIEESRSFFADIFKVFSKCPKKRTVDLVAHAFYAVDYEENNVLLHVYIRDIEHEREETLKINTRLREEADGYTLYFDEKKLTNLPLVIKRSTAFQCVLFICRSKWRQIFAQTVTFIMCIFN